MPPFLFAVTPEPDHTSSDWFLVLDEPHSQFARPFIHRYIHAQQRVPTDSLAGGHWIRPASDRVEEKSSAATTRAAGRLGLLKFLENMGGGVGTTATRRHHIQRSPTRTGFFAMGLLAQLALAGCLLCASEGACGCFVVVRALLLHHVLGDGVVVDGC